MFKLRWQQCNLTSYKFIKNINNYAYVGELIRVRIIDLNEDNHYSIVLIPKKRFATSVVVYFPETSGEEIVDIFGAHLPMEPVKLDVLDKLVRLLRI